MKEMVIRPFGGWESAARADIDTALWRPAGNISAWGQLAWDREGLRVRMQAREAHIRAEERGPWGHPWEDSCLEFFLSPAPGDERYINIELNPNACLWLGLGDGAERMRLLPERDWLRPEVFFTPDGWGVEYRVPFALLQLIFPAFEPGGVMMGNFYKCGDSTLTPHYLSWNPVTSAKPNFHRPQDFGRIIIRNGR